MHTFKRKSFISESSRFQFILSLCLFYVFRSHSHSTWIREEGVSDGSVRFIYFEDFFHLFFRTGGDGVFLKFDSLLAYVLCELPLKNRIEICI